MTGTRCFVTGCSNAYEQTRKTPGKEHIMYHTFPNNDPMRQQWVQRCWEPGSSSYSTGKRVCSEHFREDEYERDLKAELLGLPPKRRLKKTAVPSLKVPHNPPKASQSNSNVRVRKQDLKKLSKAFLHDWDSDDDQESDTADSDQRKSNEPRKGDDLMVMAKTMTLAEIMQKFSSSCKKPNPMFQVPQWTVNVIDPKSTSKAGATSAPSECEEEAVSVGTAPKRAKTTPNAEQPTITNKTGTESAPLPQGNLTVILPPKENMQGRSLCCWLEAERARMLEQENKQLKKMMSELTSKESAQSQQIEELTETNRQLKEVLFNVKGVRLASRGAASGTGPQVQTVKLAEPNIMLVVVDI